jgi:protein O-mannosyl-transferase
MLAAVPRARRWALAAFAAGALAYAPTLAHGFVADDDVVIVRNPLIRSLAALPELVSRTEWSGAGYEKAVWRPLTAASYALNHALAGLAPWSWHLVNALLHGAVAALVVVVALRLGLAPAAAGAAGLVFALQPIHVEAVANVVGRKDVLAAGFALTAVLAHRRAVTAGGAALALGPLAYAAAMLSKESGVVAVALVASADLLAPPAAASGRRRAWLYAAYAALLVAYLALFRRVVGPALALPVAFEENPLAYASPADRVLTAVALAGKGLLLQLAPLRQSPDYSFDTIPLATSALDARVLATIAAFGAWAVAGVALRRRAPIVLLALAWYLAALLPTSNLLFAIGTPFGERLLYLPSAALALLAGAGLAAAWARAPRPAAAGGAVIAAGLAVATLSYSRAWADESSLTRAALAGAPRSCRAHLREATLLRRTSPREALAATDRALAIHPRYVSALLLRADLAGTLGRPEERTRALGVALELAPGTPEVLYAAGADARDAGRLDEAARLWRRAVEAEPGFAPALGDLATWHLLRGEQDAARAYAERAVAADPGLATAWYNLALLRQARGDRVGAAEAFRRFVDTAGPELAAEADAVRRALAAGGP